MTHNLCMTAQIIHTMFHNTVLHAVVMLQLLSCLLQMARAKKRACLQLGMYPSVTGLEGLVVPSAVECAYRLLTCKY